MKKSALSLLLTMALFGLTASADSAKVVASGAKAASAPKESGAKPASALVETMTITTDEQAAKPVAEKPVDPVYDPKQYIGVGVTDSTGKLLYVAENASQTHSKENFVMVRVKGIKSRGEKEKGRVRIAVWDSETNFAKEGTKPFRASSHWAKETQNGEMVFKIAGLEQGKNYSFFAHFDKENRGFVKKVLGIPIDPFLFSNAKNQGTGPGLTREGFSPPKFDHTLVKFNNPGQEIVMEF